jgi:hypothetical protein
MELPWMTWCRVRVQLHGPCDVMLAEEAGDEAVVGTADVDGIGDGGMFP